MSTLTVRFTILAVLVALGCREQDRNYCADAPHQNCLNDDAGTTQCTSDEQCAPKVCDLTGSKACVQCTAEKPGACTATTPVCGTNDACRACAAHAECSSNVCVNDGSCAAETDVAYVAPGGSGTCGKADPCGTLDAALQTGRPYVKFATGLVKDNKTTTIDGKTVTILADPGAKLDRDGDGAILIVQSSSSTTTTNVRIFDLEITGATGVPGGDGVRLVANGGTPALALTHVTVDGNQGVGVVATGGVLNVSRSTFAQNNGGGVSESNGTFVVVGNIFFGNGGIGSSVGGIAISTTPSSTNRLEFNSFNQNTTQATIGPAIHCVVGSFAARNNIMSDNGTLSQPDQFGGSCTHTYSIARPGMMLPGVTNSASDPLFADPSKGDLHITSSSPARRGADPNSDLGGIAARDVDGTSRASPADIGAYQFKTQGTAGITPNATITDTDGAQE
jgi:hypothetical protein